MAGRRRRDDGAYDVDEVLDGLYTTPPSGFLARREELAMAARTAGRGAEARRIHEARRPTLAAWAANLLLRAQPEESHRFLELGEALRKAHQDLDPAGIKELSAQRRRIVAALTRQTADLALDAGQRLSDAVLNDVSATLQAVLADPDAADRWATGRLDSALVPPSGFPSGPAPEGAVRSGPSSSGESAVRTGTPRPARTDELAPLRRERLTRARRTAEAAARRRDERRARHADAEAAVEQARDHHGRARREADEAEERVRQAREALPAAQRALRTAEEALQAAEEELREAQESVPQVRKALRSAAGEEKRAEERARTAADALSRAEQEARRAAREAERLEPSAEE